LWLDPKPLEADLIKAYARYHTHTTPGTRGPARLWFSALNTACRQASRLLSIFSGLGEQRRQLKKMYVGGEKPGKLLEIGCGGGRFLNRMQRAGWTVEGVDFDPNAVARIARKYGIRVSTGKLADIRYADESFDVVAMSQVLEHVHDPLPLLHECRRVLLPGGRLVVTTPNSLSQAHRIYGRSWRGLEPPRHLQVFTPAALEKCARLCGFEEIRTQTLSSESAGIYRASEEIREKDEAAGRQQSAAGRILKSWLMQHDEFNRTRRDPSLGEDILMIARK
jgi:2-polyprenyl-3-methyl-5-hydroxy-6-metoxy-1,4-benzoquinol methylase